MKTPSLIKMNSSLSGTNGNITLHYFRDGLLTKYVDITITKQNIKDEFTFPPGIRLIITLQGKTQLRFNENSFCVDAEKHPSAALLSISEPTYGAKYFSGSHQQEFVIFIEPEWLKNSGLNQSPDFSHLSHIQHANLAFISLFVNKRILALIESLVSREYGSPTLSHVHKESDCLALIAELLSQLPNFQMASDLSAERKRVDQLTRLLLSGKADNWTLPEIAKHMHTNVTSLQADFKRIQGTSIMSYLRQIKLEKAYKALLQGANVNQAAEIAGYSNSDNFTTAFRRHFSIVPSKVKKRKILAFNG